jgi:hypothetical protein
MPDPKPGRTLLAIVEMGGYPNFAPLYRELGFEVITERAMRKALSLLKQLTPAVVVAEFNFQSDFRDRTSSLESLLATLQRHPDCRVVVFYEPDTLHQLDKLRSRFPAIQALPFPVDPQKLRAALG